VVFENLFSNAVKFSRQKANPLIRVEAQCRQQSCRILVKDNGEGFDMRYANKLFAIFQRLHKHSDFPGNGIGLASVYRIMQRHRGKITAKGVVGEGATFYLSFPHWK
jgi:light-regulated signal transduction histidine kinase (bacteriophytochrome)